MFDKIISNDLKKKYLHIHSSAAYHAFAKGIRTKSYVSHIIFNSAYSIMYNSKKIIIDVIKKKRKKTSIILAAVILRRILITTLLL